MARGLCAALIFCIALVSGAFAQTPPTVVPTQPSWSQLNASQRTALMPLAKEWNRISDDQKLKWLGIAVRYAKMTPVEQARLQDRMREWVALSPLEREKARAQYKKLRTMPAEAKKALEQKWQEYEALPAEEKQRLSAAAKRPQKNRSRTTPLVAQSGAAGETNVGAPTPVVNLPRVAPPKPLAVAPVVPRRPIGTTPTSVTR